MNINCIICTDLFSPTSEIFVTRCGHIFHHHCLLSWIERSKSCPQCRHKTTESAIHRVYFNIITPEGNDEETIPLLQNKVDTLKLEIRMKDKNYKTLENEHASKVKINEELQDTLSTLKSEAAKNNSALNAYREQLAYYRERAKHVDKCEADIKELKDKLKQQKIVTQAITGTVDEVQEMLISIQCPKSLAGMVQALKKEVTQIADKKGKILLDWKKAENELKQVNKELNKYKEEYKKVKLQLKAHAQCEQQQQALKMKIAEISKNLPSGSMNPTLERVLMESPAPMLTRPKQNVDFLKDTTFVLDSPTVFDQDSDSQYSQIIPYRNGNIYDSTYTVDSPTVSERVKQIQDSDSPYFNVKPYGLGLQLQTSSRLVPEAGTSIFKKSVSADELHKKQKTMFEGGFDGLGGQSKVDNFPTPTFRGVKRPKSGLVKPSSTVTSSKFKKLAKQHKKLNDFFSELE